MTTLPNQRAAGKGGIPSLLTVERSRPALPEHKRWALSMRIYNLIAVALLALTSNAGAESTNWPPSAYAEVRAYLYNLEGEGAAPILKQGKLNATVWNPE